MSLTDVTLCGKTLCSPVIAASGTFGFGGEYAGIVDMKKLGGISGKGLTLEGKYGNEGERLWETPAGLINSIGLQNPGAAAVQVGTANFSDPRACEKITDGIAAWMQSHGVRSLAEIRGCAQV